MISYLVDAVLLLALTFTAVRVTTMHRELARLRSYQGEFSTIVHETAGTFDTVISAAHDHTAVLGGAQLSLFDIARHNRSRAAVALFENGAFAKLLVAHGVIVLSSRPRWALLVRWVAAGAVAALLFVFA